MGGSSAFPAADDPVLLLTAFRGDLGLDTGAAQSVYVLDTSRMTSVGGQALAPGQTWTLPNGLGSVTFDGVREFASFSIAHDPGTQPAFIAAIVAIAGLMASLFIRRRRVWVRATEQADGRTLVAVGGLARAESGGLGSEVDDLVGRLQEAAPRDPASTDSADEETP
jgi:cytochrome c biogenesis protein